jgi:uncharacterized protein YukE
MAGDIVQMDYSVMTDVSKGFATAANTLTMIGKVLTALITILRVAAFFSAGTSAALANYLEVIKNKVNKLAKLCTEFSQDLARAVTDHKNGDIKGKKYFGEGVRG